MKMKKALKWIPLVALLILLAAGNPFHIFAAGDAGYTKIGSVAYGTNTYTDSTPAANQVTYYEITAQNSVGESAPSNVVMATTPGSGGSHSNKLTWTPGAGGGTPTAYNIYSQMVTIPNPPAALTVISN
jgi:hypothetical protein